MRINNLGISENERVADINQITPNENKIQGNKGKARDNSLTPATKRQADGTFTAVKRYMHSFLYNFAMKSTGKLKRVYFNGKKL